jgi:uncharacterized RDD family membrane protein YckC
MGCPECQSDDIGPSGVCLSCGYVFPDNAPEMESESDNGESGISSGIPESLRSEESHPAAPENEVPQWRQELSQRLHALRQKKEGADGPVPAVGKDKDAYLQVQPPKPEQPHVPAPSRSFDSAPVFRPMPKPKPPAPKQKTLQPVRSKPHEERIPVEETDPAKIRELIDNAISPKSVPSADPGPNLRSVEPVPDQSMDDEGKLILLSRTLSGLVDLIVVILCSGVFVIAADLFSGIIALDSYSYLIFSALWLLMFFFYSLFFLSASGQTLGMMITDLRVVDAFEGRPLFNQLLRRCLGYLVSLLGLGLGLVWSLFDRESMCFHDRISDTRVIRI